VGGRGELKCNVHEDGGNRGWNQLKGEIKRKCIEAMNQMRRNPPDCCCPPASVYRPEIEGNETTSEEEKEARRATTKRVRRNSR